MWLEDTATLVVDVVRQIENQMAPVFDPIEDAYRQYAPPGFVSTIDEFVETSMSRIQAFTHISGNPLIKDVDLPFMNPVHNWVVGFSYLFMVFVFAPIWKASGLTFPNGPMRLYVIFHNLFLVILSAFMAAEFIHQVFKHNYKIIGNAIDETETGHAVSFCPLTCRWLALCGFSICPRCLNLPIP